MGAFDVTALVAWPGVSVKRPLDERIDTPATAARPSRNNGAKSTGTL